jgi:hypothetical protein
MTHRMNKHRLWWREDGFHEIRSQPRPDGYGFHRVGKADSRVIINMSRLVLQPQAAPPRLRAFHAASSATCQGYYAGGLLLAIEHGFLALICVFDL